MQKVIISLVGVKKSGKSTSAELIRQMIKGRTKVIGIADKLKRELSVAYDIDLIHFNSQELKESNFVYPIRTKVDQLSHIIESFKLSPKPIKISSEDIMELGTKELRNPREMMQEVGMLIRKMFGKNVHLDHLNLKSNVTIISDVRLLTEFRYLEKLKKKGYIHIPIYIKNEEAEKNTDSHISEQEYKKFAKKCIKIDNNGKDLKKLTYDLYNVLSEHL